MLGFYLLILLGPNGAIGSWWVELTCSALTFSFTGLVIASCTGVELSLQDLPCDDGACVDGYACHPELEICVLPEMVAAYNAQGGGDTDMLTGDSGAMFQSLACTPRSDGRVLSVFALRPSPRPLRPWHLAQLRR